MTDLLGVIAASYGVLMAISPALQIRRMLQRRSSADVSLSYLLVLEVGFALWIAYGVALPNLALIVPRIRRSLPEATILVIDDGSPDGTGELADEMAQTDARVAVLHRTAKEGLSRAYAAGFARAIEGGADRKSVV